MKKEESRLDRIEKGMEKFFAGITEFKESQDRSFKRLQKQFEESEKARSEIEEGLKRLQELSEKNEEAQLKNEEAQLKNEEAQLKNEEARLKNEKARLKNEKARAIAHEKIEKEILELKEAQKKTDEQIKRMEKRVDDVSKLLGKLGIVQGEVAEDLFYRNIKPLFKKREIVFTDVKRNLKNKKIGEYDIVAFNGKLALIVEVKNKLSKKDVDEFIKIRIPRFKKAFPEYNKYKLLGGVGALVVKDDIGNYAQKSGLYLLTQNSDGGASLSNSGDFRARMFT